jgi:hypothetical protein
MGGQQGEALPNDRWSAEAPQHIDLQRFLSVGSDSKGREANEVEVPEAGPATPGASRSEPLSCAHSTS